jgi:ribosomal protein S4
VQVNGRNVNISSFNVKAGDEITIKDRPKSRQLALRNLELTQIAPVPDWLSVDRDALKGVAIDAEPVGDGRDLGQLEIAQGELTRFRTILDRDLVADWLSVDRDALKGKVAHIPSREEMQPIVNEQLIVELYSR